MDTLTKAPELDLTTMPVLELNEDDLPPFWD